MPTLLVQEYLRSGKTLADLEAEFGIEHRLHKEFPNLAQLKYNMIDSPMAEKIVQECRGLILDAANNWEVVSFPYTKFFNYGEGLAHPINWTTDGATLSPDLRVLEKIDGSLMCLYWYNGSWRVSSSGLPDANGTVELLSITFSELFWQTWAELGYTLPDDKNYTYMFELCTRFNKVVIYHPVSRIVLHGVRDITTHQEYLPQDVASKYGWECVKFYDFSSMDEVLAMAETLEAMKQEGFVVLDAATFNRIKLKTPQYVRIARMRDGLSYKNILDTIRLNESSEFLTYFPEFMELYTEVEAKFNALVSEIERVYEEIRHIEVQKEFALIAVKYPFSGTLFNMRKTGNSARSLLAVMHIDYLLGMVGKE